MTKRIISDYAVVKQIFAPNNYGSGGLVATDCSTNPVFDSYDHATFILNAGPCTSDDTIDVAIQWASTGSASNCIEIATATDAFFAQIDTDNADTNSVFVLELDFREAGMETGVLGATGTFADSDAYISMTCLLYGGTNTSSNISQDATVIKAG